MGPASPFVEIERDWRPAHLGLTSLFRPAKKPCKWPSNLPRAAGRHRSSTTQKPFDGPSLFGRRHAR